MKTNRTQNDREMLLYAFRYCITRKSMAIATCTEVLLKLWPELGSYEKEQIINETVHEIKHGATMDSTSREHWRKFLETVGGKYEF